MNPLSGLRRMVVVDRQRAAGRFSLAELALFFSLFSASFFTAPDALAQTNCTPAPIGLISWWPGDGFAVDVAGTNNGMLENGATYVPGEVGQAFNFSAPDAYVALPENFFPFPTTGTSNQPFTFEVWFKTSSGGVIFGQQNGPAYGPVSSFDPGMYVGTDGKLRAEMIWSGSVSPMTSTSTVTNGIFHHTAVSYNGTNGILYLDGVAIATNAQSQTAYASTYYYQFGTGYTSGWPAGNGGWYQFGGLIDEPTLYSRALASNEIAAIYAAGSSGKCYTNTPEPVFVQNPASQTNYAANPFSLSGAAMGTPRPQYRWLSNGVSLAGATNATLAFNNPTTNQSGAYALVASNLYGSTTSAVANLTIVVGPLLYENFESGVLDPRISISTIGTFNTYPGIFDVTFLGGTAAFGFGLSTCGANCFDSFVTYMTITFPPATYVSQLSFSSIEEYGNWGSEGYVFLNQAVLPVNQESAAFGTFDQQPNNTPTSSNTFVFAISQQVTNIVIMVRDITDVSEIFINDLLVTGQPPGPQTPVITWTNPVAITYGTALGSNQLNATVNVPGSFAYTPTNGTVLNAGTNVLSVLFAPSNTTNYSSVATNVSLVVLRVPLTVTASNASRAYGQANPVFTDSIVGLTNGDNITATNSCSATNSSPVGTYDITPALVDPNNRQTDYMVTLVNGTLTITQAVPVLKWSNPIAIAYGTALGSNQLNATANVPGGFAYTPTNGAVLNVGTNTLLVIFTPSDAVDYTAVTDVVSLVVTVCLPPPSGLVNWWPADGNAVDIEGGNNGTLEGGVSFTNGELGQSFNFNGTNGYVKTSLLVTNPQTFTLSLWFRTATTQGGVLLGFDANQTGNGDAHDRQIYFDNTGKIHFGIWLGGAELINSASSYNDDNWHLVAGTLSASNGLSLYVDGVLVGTNKAANSAQAYNGYWLIGEDDLGLWPYQPTSDYFQGQIDEVAIFNRAISSNEVAAMYEAGSAGMCLPNGQPVIVTQPTNVLVLAGSNAQFSVVAAGSQPLLYQWFFNTNALISGATNATLTLTSVSNSLAGLYSVVVTNVYGSATSAPATLAILKATPTISWMNPATITYGTALTATQLDAGANVPGSFVYNPPAGTVLNAGTNTLSGIFTPTDGIDYASVTNVVPLMVSREPLTVAAASTSRAYGQNNPSFAGTITGLFNGDDITATYSCSATPTSPAGNYPIVPSLVDPYGRLSNYQTNLINGTLTITTGPLPDLQVVSVSGPQQAWTGQAFDATFVLTNGGAGAAIGPWIDQVYLSPTNQLRTNIDQLLGSFVYDGQLAAGQGIQVIQTVTINRAGVTNGSYYLSVLADASNNVTEVTKTNNVGVSASNILVQVTPLPELNVAAVDAPTSTFDGQPVGVSWEVCNVGQSDTDVPVWYDHLYLSSTTNLSGVVLDFGEYENPDYLTPGDCYEQDATVTLPVGLSGLYYFVVSADSTALLPGDTGSNHLGYTAMAINVQLVTPGFFHTALAEVAPAPPTVTWAGQTITCTYVVQNIGQSAITGDWDDRITLSPVSNYDNGFTSGFVYENDIENYGPLAPGASYTNSASFTLPQSVNGTSLSGTWYVVPVVDIHFAAGGHGFGTGNIGRDELAASLDVGTPPPADLVTISVLAPTNAVAGQAINVTWTVANEGVNVTSSDYWYDGVYLSTNATFNASQSILLGTYGYFGGLGLTSNYTQSASFTIPATLVPTNVPYATYYLFVDADAGNFVYEFNYTNKVLAAAHPLAIQPAQYPDLAVTSVSAPLTEIAGSAAQITWSVTNQGIGATAVSSWLDSVYLSPTTNFNPATAVLLGNVTHNGALASGGSYSASQTFVLPYCSVGYFYALVFADSNGQVNENGAPASILASQQPIHIWPDNAARLGVTAVSSAATVPAGSTLLLSWTVVNSGNATTNAPWLDAIYLSPTPQFLWTNCYLLGLSASASNLATGASVTHEALLTVPRCFSGDYYVAVVTDISNVVNSISCDTNDWAISSSPVDITPSGYASLQVAGIVAPAVVNAGYPWSVEWTVTNAGPSAASGGWSDAVYASLSPTLDGTALLLGEFGYTNSLVSGATYTQVQPVTLPGCLSGNYYVYVVADVSNRVNSAACVVNNEARSAASMTVNVGAYPELVVTAVGITNTAYAAQSMPVLWTVVNAGSASANGPWLDSVYILTSGTFDTNNSVFLGSYPFNGSLAPGAAYSQSTSFTLPATTHGNFYVYVVTDSANAVGECPGASNKVAASSSLLNVPVTLYPDLKVTSVQAPGSAYSGQNVTISWVVANDGTLGTPASTVWNDAVFLSDDEVLDPSDTRLGNFASPSSLAVGQSYTNTATVQIPSGAAGPYYILVLADSAGLLFEHLGYNDSLGWNPDAMIVTLPPPADLVATNVTLSPAMGSPGSSVTIGWTDANVSSNNIPSAWTDNVYLSTNTVWDTTAVEVASKNQSGLAANGSLSASWTGTLPALTPGSYHAIVWTDARNTVNETNLANNIAVSANTIAVDVPIIILGQPVTNQISTGAAQYYKVNVPAGQTVNVTLIGASTNSFNELYVKYGAVPDLANYDFLYSTPFASDQQIEIPTTQAGWYYIMIRDGNEPGGPLGYMLEANTVPFGITGISPNLIGDNGQVTVTITGALFQAGATVELVSGTNTYFSATNFFNNGASIAARFFFTNTVHGTYDVLLTNPNNQSTTDPQAIIIETALPLTAQVVPGLVNNHPRVGLPFGWTGAVVNAGNVDIQYLTVGVALSQSFPIVLSPPPGVILADTNSSDNSAGACLFLARDLAPSGSLDFSFVVSGFDSQAFLFDIVPIVQSTSDYLNQVAAQAEAARDYAFSTPGVLTYTTTNTSGIVSTNIGMLSSEPTTALSNANLWESLFASNLIASGVLDEADLAILPSPPSAALSSLVSPADQAKCNSCADTFVGQLAGAFVVLLLCLAVCRFIPLTCAGCAATYVLAVAGFEVQYAACKLSKCGPGETPCFEINGVCPSSPNDPNEMQGPPGYSAAAFVGTQVPWQYTIYFENESNAPAYARQIAITNVINPNFDIRTFRVGEIAFGNVTIQVPSNRTFYQIRVTAPYPNPTNVVVDVSAGVDVQNNLVYWTMNAIDLNTGQLVQNANEGVLPPDMTNNIGDGHVIYTVQPAVSEPTGTVITNEAAITFDINDPIDTNPTTNTVDAVPPTSTVFSLPADELSTNFTVSWFGTDDPNGSGVADYDIYVSDDSGPWQAWQLATTATSATYSGQPGHSYAFYSVAYDNAGNVEATPLAPQAETLVSTNEAPALVSIPDQTVLAGNQLSFTVAGTGVQPLTFALQNAPSGAAINSSSGNFSWTPTCYQANSTNLITVWGTANGVPPLSNFVTFAVYVGNCAPPTTDVHSSAQPAYDSALGAFTNSDGFGSRAGLALSGSALYCTAAKGGSAGSGALFRLNTDGSGFTNLHSFSTGGGAYPAASLVSSGNILFGTAESGGSSGNGTVFRINTDGSHFTNLYNFTSGNDGASPQASLVLAGNTLYGTAQYGGGSGAGTVFRLNTDGSDFTSLYSFTGGNDGAYPLAGLVLSGNTLFGTTFYDGSGGSGTVFAINTNGGGLTTVYSFSAGNYNANNAYTNGDGAAPQAGLVWSGNTLFGTTSQGGSSGFGTVFAVNTNGGGFTNLHNFAGSPGDGAEPVAGLLLSGNTLYGAASQGGSSGNGTVFGLSTDGSAYTTLHNFSGYPGDGADPLGGLVLSGNTLYGTTELGGSADYGEVFSLVLPPILQPQLTIMAFGTNIVLSWPASEAGFTLQSSASLDPPAVWSNVSPAPVVVDGQYVVTNALSGTQTFYLLRQ